MRGNITRLAYPSRAVTTNAMKGLGLCEKYVGVLRQAAGQGLLAGAVGRNAKRFDAMD